MGDAAEAPIPFLPNQQSGLEELSGGSPVAINVTMDSLGAVTRRPGLSDYQGRTQSASSDQILGLWESNQSKLFGIRQTGPFRRVVEINSLGEVNLSTGPLGSLLGTGRPMWAETEDRVVIVGGDQPIQVDPSGGLARQVGGNPPKATHVAANSARLLLNDTTQFPKIVWFSDISGQTTGGYEAWSAAEGPSTGTAASFQGLPNLEQATAIGEGAGLVFVWGRTRTQVFVPDPTVIYAPETANEVGISAPYSIVKVDQNFAWLDHLRRFILSDGRTVTPISDPAIQGTLNALTRVDDCFGWRFLFGNTDALVWTFPTDGRTFVYQKTAGWSQWQGWDPTAERWTQLPILSHVTRASNNEHVAGTTDGRIALFSPSNTTDFGQPILASVTTGFMDHGTARAKVCRAVRLSMRRGESGAATEPVGILSWRDNLGDWNSGIPVGFGSPDDKEVVVRLPCVGGTYRRRQWKWTFSGAGAMTLAAVTEEYEVLGS